MQIVNTASEKQIPSLLASESELQWAMGLLPQGDLPLDPTEGSPYISPVFVQYMYNTDCNSEQVKEGHYH